MRRGVVAVAGDVGDYAGTGMLAGTLLVFGRLGRRPGAGLRRGTIVAGSEVELLPTFRYACTYRPTFLLVYLRRLRQAYGFDIEPRFFEGAYRRYNGDFADLGRGEILVWTTP
jgi:formylmethanofuran dehydrogenase subunit C